MQDPKKFFEFLKYAVISTIFIWIAYALWMGLTSNF